MTFSQESFISASCRSDSNSQEQLSSQTSTTSSTGQTSSRLDNHVVASGTPDNTLLASKTSYQNTLTPQDDGDTPASQTSCNAPKTDSSNPSAPSSDNRVDPFSLKLKATNALKKQRDTTFNLFDEAKSQPRLSTSLTGSVRIKTGASPSPSPPRSHNLKINPQPRAPGPLQRSQSAIITSTSLSARPTASFGRSKDSRSWQFFCDPVGGDELSKQAELEQKGSAAGAINLLRCKSKESLRISTINGNSNKRTAASVKLEGQKRAKKDGDAQTVKPKLARTTSSAARLQNPSNQTPKLSNSKHNSQDNLKPAKLEKDPKKKSTTVTIFTDGNESDKENWAPGTEVPVPSRRRHRNHTNGTINPRNGNILRENPFMSSQSTSLNPRTGNAGNSRANRASQTGKENKDCGVDEEVSAFMSGGNVIIGEDDDDEEDLSCVQGLLSLSQGAWR